MGLSYKYLLPYYVGLLLLGLGLLCLLIVVAGGVTNPEVWGITALAILSIGSIISISSKRLSRSQSAQWNGTWSGSVTARGAPAWVLGVVLTGFYVVLYWFPEYLQNLTESVDPLSRWLRNRPSDHWFLYGLFYTLAILVMGVHALLKYRNSRYHIIRTFSVMFFQLCFAFLLPALLLMFNQPEFYFSYFWPLKYEYLFPANVQYLVNNGEVLGVFMVFWGVALSFVATPVLTYFFGKRWYCSWVCGCGGLAETAGDPFQIGRAHV